MKQPDGSVQGTVRCGLSRVEGSWARTDRPQMPGRGISTSSQWEPSRSHPSRPSLLTSICSTHSRTVAPYTVAGAVSCHGQPSLSITTPSPALHSLDGSQPLPGIPICLPTQCIALPLPPEKVPVLEPKPCQESQSQASLRGPSGHGQELWGKAGRARHRVALPGSPASSPWLNPTLVPFPPPEDTALLTSRNPV